VNQQRSHFKDEVLHQLSQKANVAQFVSFSPDLKQRFAAINELVPNTRFPSPIDAIRTVLSHSSDNLVNVRSFRPDQPEGSEFIFAKRDAYEVLQIIERLAAAGFYTIVNETIDVNDGGVSGVLLGDVIEFAPGETPRCVEGTQFVSLPRKEGLSLLKKVYGFKPTLDYPVDLRVEFSLHPRRRGIRGEHTIIWEIQQSEPLQSKPAIQWPNSFSRMIGDKAFGLLIGETFGFRVPRTLVLGRKVAPFEIGRPTGEMNKWTRTAPMEPKPGFFKTTKTYSDPFTLLAEDDPERELASVLIQDEVPAVYSGAVLTDSTNSPLIEGVAGTGDLLMIGTMAPTQLPDSCRLMLRYSIAERIGSSVLSALSGYTVQVRFG
jgi:hypothetical protein